jgi:hypothetical protein
MEIRLSLDYWKCDMCDRRVSKILVKGARLREITICTSCIDKSYKARNGVKKRKTT